jgi:hypothetical protein
VSSGNNVNILHQTMVYAVSIHTDLEFKILMFSLVFPQAPFMSPPAVKFSKATKCSRS